MRRLLTTTTALLALAAPLLTTLLTTGSAHAETEPPIIAIKPATIARGADIAVPHLEGTTIVDGAVRVPLNTARARLYGKWQGSYIAATGNKQWGNVKLWRVSSAGATKQLAAGIDPFNTLLDAEADQVVYSYGDSTSRPTIGLYDLGLDKELAARAFASLPTLLEFDQGLVVATFTSLTIKTVTWDTVANLVVKVNGKQSNYASKAHDLLGYFNKDPFLGGCQVLAHLSDPTDVLWTNCDERIEAVSPDGRRVATIPLLSDGIGPADVLLRKIGGTPLAHYTIAGWFGAVTWETSTKLLMESNGKNRSATIRCKVTDCDRATDLVPTPDFRVG
jgi:hypothetical protein